MPKIVEIGYGAGGVTGQGTYATSSSSAGSMALDFDAGSHQKITLTGNQTGITYSTGLATAQCLGRRLSNGPETLRVS